MTAIALRIIIFLVIGAVVFFGVRRIWRDFSGHFKAEEQQIRQRDLSERKRPDVIDLKRSDDGIYRPPGDDEPKR